MTGRPEALVRAALPDGLPFVGDFLRARLAGVFGPPPITAAATPGDGGLCGPGSASWTVIGDPAAIVGGVRGLLVQTLHPAAMAGVHDHSSFATDPLGRLARTTDWVLTATFGATSEALATAARVRAAHRRVVGTTPSGRRYAASEPRLLAWVQGALTSSFLATDALYAAEPLDGPRRDAFVIEQSRLAALLDERVDLTTVIGDDLRSGRLDERLPMLVDGTLPRDESGLTAMMASYDWELEVGEQARGAVAFLVAPPLPLALRPAYAVTYAGAVASLDASVRRRLGLPLPVPPALAQVATRVNVATLRLATGPSQVERAARARIAAAA